MNGKDLCRQLFKNQSKAIKRAKNDCTRFLGCVSYDNSIELHAVSEKDAEFSQNTNFKLRGVIQILLLPNERQNSRPVKTLPIFHVPNEKTRERNKRQNREIMR